MFSLVLAAVAGKRVSSERKGTKDHEYKLTTQERLNALPLSLRILALHLVPGSDFSKALLNSIQMKLLKHQSSEDWCGQTTPW